MDMPRFNGDNPTSWLFRADLFFEYFDIPDDQCVTVASIYMDGPAMDWYQSLYQRGKFSTWDRFQTALLARFGPSPFRDIRGEIAKVHQTSTVEEYYNRFVKLTNQMPDIDARWLQSYFESGLAPAIQNEVRGRRPESIEEALHFALLQEGRVGTDTSLISVQPRRQPFPSYSATPALQPPPPTLASVQPLPALLPPPARPHTTPSAPVPVIRLNPTQMMERKAQGLCFNCDEKYHKGHMCKAKLFSMELIWDDDDEDLSHDLEPVDYG